MNIGQCGKCKKPISREDAEKSLAAYPPKKGADRARGLCPHGMCMWPMLIVLDPSGGALRVESESPPIDRAIPGFRR